MNWSVRRAYNQSDSDCQSGGQDLTNLVGRGRVQVQGQGQGLELLLATWQIDAIKFHCS